MAVNIGNAVFDVEADTGPARRSLRGLENTSQRRGRGIGRKLGSGFKTTAVAGFRVAGAAAAAAAVGAIAVGFKGISAAVDFDTRMREVFTLLPDISDEAMGEMREQVLGFTREFGVLTEDAVPALYQALSLGVPRDNVFEFLETAQMAARGGVTELETAVTGISSVINAYGREVLSGAEASDLMFTAVKRGGTTFDELANSLFQVTPTAAALGVEFADVTAGAASLTAQGVPTQVATTQMRQMFVELSKSGGETAEVFKEMSGQTFQEFIAEGGNTAEALAIMQEAAEESGVGLQDLFGSVEAGQAALGLSGANAEGFTENIEAMGESTGATKEAFDTMMEGLQPIVDRLKAIGEAVLINIGEFLIPKLLAAVDFVEKHWPTISAVFEAVRDAIGEAIMWVVDNVIPPLIDIFEEVQDWVVDNWPAISDTIGDVAGAIMDFLGGVVDWIGDNLIPIFEDAVGWVVDNWPEISDAISDAAHIAVAVLETLADALVATFQWVINNKPVLIGVLTAIGVGFAAWAVSAAAAAVSTALAIAPFILIGAAIAAVVAAVIYAYQEWDAFRAAVDAVREWLVNTLWPALQDVFGWLQENVPPILQAIADIWTGVVQPALEVVWSFISQNLWPIFREFGKFLINVYVGYIQVVVDIIQLLWGWLRTLWDRSEGLRGFLVSAFKVAIDTTATAFGIVRDVVETVWSWLQILWDRSEPFRAFLVDAFKVGIDIAAAAFGFVRDAIEAVWSWVQTLWDRTGPFRAHMVDSFKPGIDAVAGAFETVRSAIGQVWGWIQVLWDRAQPFRDFLENAFKVGVETARDIIDDVASAISSVWGWVQVLWDRAEPFKNFMEGAFHTAMSTVKSIVDGVASAFDAVASAVESAVGWIDRLPTSLPSWVNLNPTDSGLDAVLEAAAGGQGGGTGSPAGNALGTNFWRGGMTWVGEQGPELVRLPRGSEVFTAQESRQMVAAGVDGAGAGSDMPNVNVSVTVNGGGDPARIETAVRDGTLTALARYRQARGS